ncbi:MAG: lipid-A-disaccharide synthase [Hyphomicrobiaceae bacterium]
MSRLPRRDHAVRIYVVAGDHSGDSLGGKLLSAIHRLAPRPVRFEGVGGRHMADAGLASQFPISDVAVMGPLAILGALPRLVCRVNQAARAGVAMQPDAVVIIDSPEFTHPVARRIRKALPDVPIVNYVSPSVWAWRPKRAPRMRAYIDHVLALLPFEPSVHVRLGGPECTYVGHPLVERLPEFERADPAALRRALGLDAARKLVVLLPGSRRSEVERLIRPFGNAMSQLEARVGPLEVVIPAVESVRQMIEGHVGSWPVRVHLVSGEDAKLAAFKAADVALAASGTVTLELALAGTPMLVSYRVDALAASLGFLVKTPHFALSNLVLGERAFPELMQEDCTPEKLAAGLARILTDPETRAAQERALARMPELMQLSGGAPSEAAAAVVLRFALDQTRSRSLRAS